jgi:hypothetical protein
MLNVWAFCHMTDINTIIHFVKTHRSMASSTLATDVVMPCFRPFALTGSGGTKTLSLIYPHKKKSQGVRSGLLGGQCDRARFWSVERCLERIGLSYWYLSCDKKLRHRTFVTYTNLKTCTKTPCKYFGYISSTLVSIKRWKCLFLL